MLARTVAPPPPPRDFPHQRRTGTALGRLALVGALVLNLVVLYAPDPGTAPGAGLSLDKGVHAAIFALLTLAGLRAGLDPRWFLPAVLAHAVSSEIIQAVALPARAGDPVDALADAVGIALGYVLHRRWPRRRTGPAAAGDAGG